MVAHDSSTPVAPLSTPLSAPLSAGRRGVVLRLGLAQTLAWASTYYLPAILARPMAAELGLTPGWVFAFFSGALLISAVVGPLAGRQIDRHGGRGLLMATSLVFALGLALLALAHGPLSLALGWAVLGLAMGAGLYEAGFASLVRLYGQGARNAITGITLLAGFASTVGWPLSGLMLEAWGWRGACLGWAGLHISLGLWLNSRLPRLPDVPGVPGLPQRPHPTPQANLAPSSGGAAQDASGQGAQGALGGEAAQPAPPTAALDDSARLTPAEARLAAVLLAAVFAAAWFTSTALAAHLPALLQAGGLSLAAAVGIGALVGPAQVAGRLLEFGWLRRLHPLLSARLAALSHPVGAALVLALGAGWAAPFALLHGMGNGILTIAKGTLPLVLFGSGGYGARQGLITLPSRVAQAAAPWLFGLGVERVGLGMLWLSTGLGLLAFAALMFMPQGRRPG
ncbi:MAG: hypothetical protein RL722_2453 [Pseudomonadota bacterium]|jgi:MFS family permease